MSPPGARLAIQFVLSSYSWLLRPSLLTPLTQAGCPQGFSKAGVSGSCGLPIPSCCGPRAHDGGLQLMLSRCRCSSWPVVCVGGYWRVFFDHRYWLIFAMTLRTVGIAALVLATLHVLIGLVAGEVCDSSRFGLRLVLQLLVDVCSVCRADCIFVGSPLGAVVDFACRCSVNGELDVI